VNKNLPTASPPNVGRTLVRFLGALVLLFVGADHYYEYSVDHYAVLPTIGTLFLVNFISATVVGMTLLAPLGRLFHRFDRIVLQLAAIGGFGIAATSLVALLVSEQTKLFGFMESNYRPAIIVAIASEASAAVLLALLFALTWSGKRSVENSKQPPRGRSQPSAGATGKAGAS
jgi:hypothetical protein